MNGRETGYEKNDIGIFNNMHTYRTIVNAYWLR